MLDKLLFFIQARPFKSSFLAFILIFCFQSLNIFWGFELLDSGFHLTAFDNVFDAPDSVSYNFLYYLTNIIGGAFLKLFPNLGIVGFRIIGVLFIDCSILLIILCLRKEIPIIHLLIGGIIVVFYCIFIPYSFNNGICSCFFYICALLSLYKGLINERSSLIILSGIIVGINIFSRIPNILAVGLVLIVLFHNYIEGNKHKIDWRYSLLFLLSVVLGIMMILIFMRSLGHLTPFMEAINILFTEGISSSNGHSAFLLIWAHIYFYLNAILFLTFIFSLLYIDKELKKPSWRIFFTVLAIFILFCHVYLKMGYDMLWAFCVIGCILCLQKNGNIALLASLALYMLFFEILGSNSANNHGSLPALLAAPVASYTILNRRIILYVFIVCVALVMKVVKQGNFFDGGTLFKKNYTLNAQECSLIKTTRERAEAINLSLPALRSYIHQQDTLLVYRSAPMMNFLTHTRPAGGMCWPVEGFFVKPFESAPKILIHKFENFAEPTHQTCGIPTGNQMLDTYMKEHRYGIVYENPYFILLFPYQK